MKTNSVLTEILKPFMGALHVLCFMLKAFTVDFFTDSWKVTCPQNGHL